MGLCVGMIRGDRANGTLRISSSMGNGLVPDLGPFRALVSGPLTDKGASDLTCDWARDLTCDGSGDCLRKPGGDPRSRDWSGDVPTVTCWEEFLLRRSVRNRPLVLRRLLVSLAHAGRVLPFLSFSG
jgi:hypothetical protein